MSDPITTAAELEAVNPGHQTTENSVSPWSSQASACDISSSTLGPLLCSKDSPVVATNVSSLYGNVKSTAPMAQDSPLATPQQPDYSSTLSEPSSMPSTRPSSGTSAAAQALAARDPSPAPEVVDMPSISPPPNSEANPNYIALLLAAMNTQPPPIATGHTAAAAPTIQSWADGVSSLGPPNTFSCCSSAGMPAPAAMTIPGSSPMPQPPDATLQQLQLARLLLIHRNGNNSSTSTPNTMSPTFAGVAPSHPQQLLPSSNSVAGSAAGDIAEQLQQLYTKQLALAGGLSAGGNLGLGLAPPVDLGVVHAAAVAATAAVANQRAAMEIGMQSSQRSSSPARHTFRSDGSINTLYKTQMCRAWINTGYCKYEERCQFAHGSSDVHGMYRPAKYKTVPCRNIKNLGRCPFGKRCNFIHGVEDDLSPRATSSGGASSITGPVGAAESESKGSRRSSSSSGTMPGHFGAFAGAAGLPSMLAPGMQCDQLVMPGNLEGFGLGGMNVGNFGGLNFGGLNVSNMNIPTGMVAPATGNIANLIQYGTSFGLVPNESPLGLAGGFNTAVGVMPRHANAGTGVYPASSVGEMLRMMQLR